MSIAVEPHATQCRVTAGGDALGFGSFFGKKKSASSDSEFAEKRLHPRYNFSVLGYGDAVFAGAPPGKIFDLSYSGFGVQFANDSDAAEAPKDVNLAITFLGDTAPARASKVYARHNLCGYFFQHQDPTTLIFLRRILEFCRFGSSLVELEKKVVHDRYATDAWLVLRGDGPSDVVLEREKDRLRGALITFLDGKDYCQLRFTEGCITTGRSIGKSDAGIHGVGEQMRESLEVDLEVLRKALYILAGCNLKPVRELCQPLLAESLKLFAGDSALA